MPQLLLELFSEEIPARMQAGAARDLARMAAERLAAAGLTHEALRTYAGPRRLTLVVDGLPAATPDRAEELKGPKASAPPQAVEGFLRKTGLPRDALVERDGVLYAVLATAGRPTREIVTEMLGAILRAFPWPKSMRSGMSAFRWVRPLKRILCLFDGAAVPFEVDGVAAGDLTQGHRFMGPRGGAPFAVTGFDDYRAKLAEAYVVLDAADRRARIEAGARALCAARGLELVEDEGLLDEVAGLAEWPVPILGDMDAAFLDLPPEVVRTSMRTHQKYFAVRRLGEAGLAPHFVVVANVEASDGGALLAAGNARVLSARLNDARFFWNEDRKEGAFERWAKKLEGVTFHAKLGTMAERVERIAALARELAPLVGADPDLAERAARLCKLDLASAMVGEFPELQGVMGGYYARLAGEGDAVADAVRDHYKPVGPGDSVPTAPVTVAVALADKLELLGSFWAIAELPTGSRDPYALRRAALGVISLLLNGVHRVPLTTQLTATYRRSCLASNLIIFERLNTGDPRLRTIGERQRLLNLESWWDPLTLWMRTRAPPQPIEKEVPDLLAFFADRLKVLLREEGRRHDLVDAVFALGDDDLVRIVARVDALSTFLASDDGANLLAGYKRAVNILKQEEKKHPSEASAYAAAPQERADSPPEQVALHKGLLTALSNLDKALPAEDFAGAMTSLAQLRAPVDAFFERVLVNDPDPEVRLDRLRLLNQIRAAADRVAVFSLISG